MQPLPQTSHTMTQDARTIAAIDSAGVRYPIGKMDAHVRGVLHDAVSVFLFDRGETLLQQRADSKYHCGGKWANACCTHPDWGERSGPSARRRLKEELGLDVDLHEVSETTYRASVGGGLTEHERVRIFSAEVNREALTFDLNPEEVSRVQWMSVSDLRRAIAADPTDYAPWLRIYVQRWEELGLPL